MRKIGLAIATAVAGMSLAVSVASAAPDSIATQDGAAGLVHKAGGVYIDIGPPRYYGYYGGYYDRYPAYDYGYYGPRRYYRYGYDYDDYGRSWHGRRWTQERFRHPLGRR